MSDVNRDYEVFLQRIEPPRWDRVRLTKEIAQLSNELKAQHDDLDYLTETGSTILGIDVTGHSDVDLFAWMPFPRPQLPSSALRTLNDYLYFCPSVRDTRIDRPPVVVTRFAGPPDFEVVPAYYSKSVGDEIVFLIPGPDDKWIEAAPTAHIKFINYEADRKPRNLVKGLIRLMKAWKYANDVPISSFYLEMRTAQFAKNEEHILWSYDVPAIMSEILDHDLRDMNDPTGMVSRIPAAKSQAAQAKVRAELRKAIPVLEKARDRKPDRSFTETMLEYYNMHGVFGEKFPAEGATS